MKTKINDRGTLEQVKLQNGKAFCPCSGHDIQFIMSLVGDFIDHFVFCDVNYRPRRESAKPSVPEGWRLLSSISGMDTVQKPKKTWYIGDREFQPFSKIETWKRPDSTEVLVELRKDLAQDFLVNNCQTDSISCFMHINDGTGEGGSDLWFLATDASPNIKGMLAQVCLTLTNTALVVSDGKMADDRFKYFEGFEMYNRSWEPIHKIKTDRYHKIIVWKTTKLK